MGRGTPPPYRGCPTAVPSHELNIKREVEMLKELFPNAIPLPHDRQPKLPEEYCVLGALARFINLNLVRLSTIETADLESFPMCGRTYRYLRAIFPYEGEPQSETHYMSTIGNLVGDIQRANDKGQIEEAYEMAEALLDVCRQERDRSSYQGSRVAPEGMGGSLPT